MATRHDGGAPFMKWVGGKRKVAARICELLPWRPRRYYEPFCGSAAVFFHSRPRGRIVLPHDGFGDARCSDVLLSDLNADLIEAFRGVRDCVEDVIWHLSGFVRDGVANKEYYHAMRDRVPADLAEAAARTIFLNRAGFNAKYVMDKAGRFRGSWGGNRPASQLLQPEVIRAASSRLKGADLRVGDFRELVDAGEGDAVYCDPPYVGLWREYGTARFETGDLEDLRDYALRWADAGAVVVLSDSMTDLTRKMYSGPRFERWELPTFRCFSPDRRRGKYPDLLVRVSPP